jgi:hypothetical protein
MNEGRAPENRQMPQHPLPAVPARVRQLLSAVPAPRPGLRTLHVDMNLIADQLDFQHLDLRNIQERCKGIDHAPASSTVSPTGCKAPAITI